MKKSLVALAVLAASGAAMAQSSVTLWGVADAGLTQASSAVNKKTQLTNSNISSSQLGFRGNEDLGGGMAAHTLAKAGAKVCILEAGQPFDPADVNDVTNKMNQINDPSAQSHNRPSDEPHVFRKEPHLFSP